MSGKGHPLPRSDEARHDRIPEHLEAEKGRGDDSEAAVQPAGAAVAPDGVPYSPGRGNQAGAAPDDLAADQAEHQDRGQSAADEEAGRD